jgi:hypothetical protein
VLELADWLAPFEIPYTYRLRCEAEPPDRHAAAVATERADKAYLDRQLCDGLAALEQPRVDVPPTQRCDLATAGAKCKRPDGRVMPERSNFAASGELPDARNLVSATRCEHALPRTERDGGDLSRPHA